MRSTLNTLILILLPSAIVGLFTHQRDGGSLQEGDILWLLVFLGFLIVIGPGSLMLLDEPQYLLADKFYSIAYIALVAGMLLFLLRLIWMRRAILQSTRTIKLAVICIAMWCLSGPASAVATLLQTAQPNAYRVIDEYDDFARDIELSAVSSLAENIATNIELLRSADSLLSSLDSAQMKITDGVLAKNTRMEVRVTFSPSNPIPPGQYGNPKSTSSSGSIILDEGNGGKRISIPVPPESAKAWLHDGVNPATPRKIIALKLDDALTQETKFKTRMRDIENQQIRRPIGPSTFMYAYLSYVVDGSMWVVIPTSNFAMFLHSLIMVARYAFFALIVATVLGR